MTTKVSQWKLQSGWGLNKRRSVPPFGSTYLGKNFTLYFILLFETNTTARSCTLPFSCSLNTTFETSFFLFSIRCSTACNISFYTMKTNITTCGHQADLPSWAVVSHAKLQPEHLYVTTMAKFSSTEAKIRKKWPSIISRLATAQACGILLTRGCNRNRKNNL